VKGVRPGRPFRPAVIVRSPLEHALDLLAAELDRAEGLAGVRFEAAGLVVCVARGDKGKELSSAWDTLKADEKGPPS